MKHCLLIITILTLSLCKINAQNFSRGGYIEKEDRTRSLGQSMKILQNIAPEQLTNIELPDLELLLENAKGSPDVLYNTYILDEQKQDLRLSRRKWLDHFVAIGQYQYGTGMYYNINTEQTNNPYPVQSLSKNAQHMGSLGINIGIPFSTIFNRGVNKKINLARINQAEMQIDKSHQDLSNKIINLYIAANQYLSIVKTTYTTLNYAKGQYLVTEQEFINGRKTAIELGTQEQLETQATERFELAKAELCKALLSLEQLSNTKIIIQ